MKNKSGYAKLKQKIFLQMTVIVLCSIGAVALLRSVTRGHLADGILNLLCSSKGWTLEQADMFYQVVVRNNMSFIFFLVALLFLLILLYFFISSFRKYFDEIIHGVELLGAGQEEPIVLCRELGFMEKELNEIKNALEEKTRIAKEAEQRKNDLVVYLAHDIKTPLTSVLGYLELLNDIQDLPQEQREKYLQIALEKGNRLEILVNEFFDITRFGFQEIALHKEKLDLSLLLCQLAENFYPQATAKGQEVKVQGDSSAIYYGDSDKLGRVFGNLLKNAVTYGRENSEIIIALKKAAEGISITFTNQGQTLSSHDLKAVFEKFYRADASRSTQTGGAGLGLAIAKEFTEAHGGKLTVDSTNGVTVFSVFLPRSAN